MERAPAEIQGTDLIIHMDRLPNMDYIETVAGQTEWFWVDYEVADTRQATHKQRRLFFALLDDIGRWSGDSPEWLKDHYFYPLFAEKLLKTVSVANNTESSVTDVNMLINLVIDFIFEWSVPVNVANSLLPRDQAHFLYQCCRHRECTICGRHADIHHVDVIGAGVNRNSVDHTKRHVLALCRRHHFEIEQIGPTQFSRKYHLPVDGIKLDVATLRRIGVRGDYSNGFR
jgi:hypothetical protein